MARRSQGLLLERQVFHQSLIISCLITITTGTALLVLLAWLCWASLPVFRKRYYELFKWLHVVSALLFTAFFFVHW